MFVKPSVKCGVAVFLLVVTATTISGQLDVDLQSKLPPEFAKSNLTLDDARKILKEKCRRVSPDDTDSLFEGIEKATTVLTECLSELVNVTAIQTEIEIAKPIGELDTVFVKYCSKRPEAEKCLLDFNDKIQPCLDKEEKAGSAVMVRIVKSIFNFVCYKGGDQIALFYAEKGPECFESNKEEITDCLNSTFAGYIPKDSIPDINAAIIPKLVMGPKQCEDVKTFEKCVLNALETCEEITPSNIVGSLFRFVKNETQCPGDVVHPRQSSSRNSGASLAVMSLFGISWLVLIQRLFV